MITFSFSCEDLQSGSQIFFFFFLSWLICSLSGQTHKDVGEVISTKKMRKVTPVNFFFRGDRDEGPDPLRSSPQLMNLATAERQVSDGKGGWARA